MRIRQLQHSVYQTNYHIVWGTKYRRKILKHYVKKELIKSLYSVQKKYPDWYFHKINIGDDHIHILMEIPPKYAISEVVKKIKVYSSQQMKKKFKYIDRIYPKRRMWSVGYFVSTVGLNEEQIKRYIEKQSIWDAGIDVTDEFS